MDESAPQLTPEMRDAIIRSSIASLALDGIHISREEAERLFDKVLAGPLPDLDGGKSG